MENSMTDQTWGIYIPGYSYPSIAQQRKFNRMYPGAAARHKEASERAEIKEHTRRMQAIAEEKAIQNKCEHMFVPTNIGEERVCRHCKLWVEKVPEEFVKQPEVEKHLDKLEESMVYCLKHG